MRDAEASLPPARLPAAGNVLLTAAESLNEDDLRQQPFSFFSVRRAPSTCELTGNSKTVLLRNFFRVINRRLFVLHRF